MRITAKNTATPPTRAATPINEATITMIVNMAVSSSRFSRRPRHCAARFSTFRFAIQSCRVLPGASGWHDRAAYQSTIMTRWRNALAGSRTPADSSRSMKVGRIPLDSNWPRARPVSSIPSWLYL